ncbi:MAG: DUF3987 domain-containing protein, partial [Erysipelotrichia bacterium]|nr:DUF3987 domain-containing protein [Erysipelotrichia bacterium]
MNKFQSLDELNNEIPACAVGNPAVSAVANWPDPDPIIDRTKSEPFPIEDLPEKIRSAFIEAQADIKAPIEFIAASGLSAMSLAIQSKIDVARNARLKCPVSLYTLIIADSGDRKSSADKAFTSAIRHCQNEISEKNKPLMQEYQSNLSSWEAERAGCLAAIKQAAGSDKINAVKDALRAIDEEKPIMPKSPNYLYQNFSIEGLRKGLSEWPSAGLFSAEAGAVFGSYGMRKESALDTLGNFNSFWSDEPISFKRLVSESGNLQNCRLTISLAIQQGALDEFLKQSGDLARSSGFWARCLIACPQSIQGTRFYEESGEVLPNVDRFNARIREILDKPDRFDDAGRLILETATLSTEAKRIWIDYFNRVERELRPQGELTDVRDFASKSAEQATRLAALLEYFCTGNLEISAGMMKAGNTLAAWYLAEAQRYFSAINAPENERNAVLLETWLIEKTKDLVTAATAEKATAKIEKQFVGKYCPYRLRT